MRHSISYTTSQVSCHIRERAETRAGAPSLSHTHRPRRPATLTARRAATLTARAAPPHSPPAAQTKPASTLPHTLPRNLPRNLPHN
eukprot:7110224-Prymnesium_polylepis.1